MLFRSIASRHLFSGTLLYMFSFQPHRTDRVPATLCPAIGIYTSRVSAAVLPQAFPASVGAEAFPASVGAASVGAETFPASVGAEP